MTRLILGFDPGREKCGLAVVRSDGSAVWREIASAVRALDRVQGLWEQYQPTLLVLGDQTSSRQWQTLLQQHLPTLPVVTVDERHSSLQARKRYWNYYPAQGWMRLLPLGLRVPPQPYDDIVAQILVERYLAQQGE